MKCSFSLVVLLLSVFIEENKSERLLAEIHRQSPDKNVITSPFLLSVALTMLHAGARENTAEELLRAIKLLNRGNELEAIDYSKLQRPELTFGNGLFVAENVNILPSYKEFITKFDTKVNQVDFSDSDKTVAKISDWVSKQTAGKITSLVKSTDASMQIILASAIYFHGSWQNKFDKANTRKSDFNERKNGITQTVKVDMMNQFGSFKHKYLKELNAKAISLPYANSNISMVIILPTEVDGIDSLIEKLSTVNNLDILKRGKTSPLFLDLPKFKFNFETQLNDVLQNMGVLEIFKSANLRGMTDITAPLELSEVLQKGTFEVDEEGATAAVAVAFEIGIKSSPDYFVVDRPFVFYIQDDKRTYFSGQVNSIE